MKRLVLVFLAVLAALATAVPTARPVVSQHVLAAPKVKLLISFERSPGIGEHRLVRDLGGRVTHRYHLIPAVAAELPEPTIEVLAMHPGVLQVERDGTVRAIDEELDNSWGVKRIGAGTVHGYNKGTDINIAVIDSGIDYNHSDLNANYDGGYDFVNDDTDPMDDYGHGTHVAGTIAAEDENTDLLDSHAGVVGVAPEANLYALKVLDGGGFGNWSDVIAALEWAVDNEAKVANLSLGSLRDPGGTVQAAFDNAEAAGLLIVAAAGNSGNLPGKGDNVEYPARYSSVIAVAATDSSDNRASFSSTGDQVELAAPGVDVLSTVPTGSCPICDPTGYYEGSGTSMASPHVAGTAALVIASGVTSNVEVRQILRDTADDLGDTGKDNQFGYGLVDADEAAPESGAEPTPTPTPTATPLGPEPTPTPTSTPTVTPTPEPFCPPGWQKRGLC